MKKNERSHAGTDVWNCLWGSVVDFLFFSPTNYTENGIQTYKNADGRDCPGETGQKWLLITLLSVKTDILMKSAGINDKIPPKLQKIWKILSPTAIRSVRNITW